MVILGSISYTQAARIIKNNYKETNLETIRSIAMYFDLVMDTVSAKTQEIANDGQVVSYYTKGQDMNSADFGSLYRDIKTNLVSAKTSTDSIASIYIVGQGKSAKSDKISNSSTSGKTGTVYDTYSVTPHSTAGDLPKNFYARFLETGEAAIWQDTIKKENWYGYHIFLDEQGAIEPNSYAVSLVRSLSKGDGYIIADLKMQSVISILDQLVTEEGCEAAFVTADGREIRSSMTKITEGCLYESLSCFKEALASEDESGFYEFSYQGGKYIFTYSRIGETGSLIYTILPTTVLNHQVSGIGIITVIIVILACVIALGIGLILAIGINHNIRGNMRNLQKASKGDMTVHFSTKRKDELGMLATSLNEMLENIRKLIAKVSDVGIQVNNTAYHVSEGADMLFRSSGDISIAISEISHGNSQQAIDTNHCAELMGQLSNQIEKISEQSVGMSKTAADAKETVTTGMQIMDDLNVKARETTKITGVVITGIEELNEKSTTIHNIVGAIEEIAEQTNLLSLNASIEAARAGEAGKGFAVVADEIRKLADQSMQAADEIRSIIEEIQDQTETTSNSAKEAEKIVKFQEEALQNTIDAFHNINTQVLSLTADLEDIADDMLSMEQAKITALDVIQNISAVSQQTAATSQEMAATIDQQNISVKDFAEKSEVLAEDARMLEETIGTFTI